MVPTVHNTLLGADATESRPAAALRSVLAQPGSMRSLYTTLELHDGMATTAELRAAGVERFMIDIAVMYGRVLRVRKGLWCLPSVPKPVVAAQRAKGRLACVSALVYHGEIEDHGFDLHVSARLGQVSWHPVPQRRGLVRHWSRRPLGGDRFAVGVQEAWDQFATCDAVAGREVRSLRPDSL